MNKISLAELSDLENKLTIKLPSEYKRVLIDYPFEENSFADLCMLISDINILNEWNSGSDFLLKNRFAIGSDGGEETYYLDLRDPKHPVYSFDLETDKSVCFAERFEDYLTKIAEIETDIESDEILVRKRRENSKWWEFWKRI